MKMISIELSVIAVCTLLFPTAVNGKQIAVEPNNISCSFEIPEPWQSPSEHVTKQVKFPELPESNLYRLGTRIDESFLGNPDMATKKSSSIGKSSCKDKRWIGGTCSFVSNYVVKNPEPLPTELPADEKDYWLEMAKEKKARKPDFNVDAFIQKRLEQHRKSKEYINKGQLDITILNAPSAKAAFEYLVIKATVGSNMFLESIISQFDDTAKVNGLGTVGYRSGSTIRFIRDNIAVIVQADGDFKSEAMDIAKKIDAALLKQPMLTYEQLQARCPKLHIGPGKKTVETEVPSLEYSVEAPTGVQAWIRDIKINGKTGFGDNSKIYLAEKPKKVKVEATVVSNELLVSTFEKEIEMPE